jgi:hypothetical protein
MFRTALRPAALSLLLVALAAAAQAQNAVADTACATGVARDFNRLMPPLAELQREGHQELPGLVSRLNALRSRITAAMDEAAPSGEPCDTLVRELAAERELLQRLVPAAVVQASPPPPPAAVPVSPPPLRAKAPVRAAERPAERRVPALPPTPVKRAAYTPPPPASAPRLDPELESCKTQLRQNHADAQLKLQMAARSGRIVPQKLPDMQRAQSRLAGLQGAVRRDFETLGECQQVGQALVQEVDGVQALAR